MDSTQPISLDQRTDKIRARLAQALNLDELKIGLAPLSVASSMHRYSLGWMLGKNLKHGKCAGLFLHQLFQIEKGMLSLGYGPIDIEGIILGLDPKRSEEWAPPQPHPDLQLQIRAVLRKERIAKGISILKISRHLGMLDTNRQLYRMESGEKLMLDCAIIEGVSQFLGINPFFSPPKTLELRS